MGKTKDLFKKTVDVKGTFHVRLYTIKDKYSEDINKQGDNIQPWHTLFQIWNQSVVPCPVLPVAS